MKLKCWSPHAQNELLCAFANSNELRTYDLGSANPTTPSRVLRSSRAYAAGNGVADVALPPHSNYLAAGGRDGQLRIWDVRSRSALVAQAEALTGSWTMGVRAQDLRAGAISALAASADGERLLLFVARSHMAPSCDRLVDLR